MRERSFLGTTARSTGRPAVFERSWCRLRRLSFRLDGVGNRRQAMLVLALRVRKHRALGNVQPPRGRSESHWFLTRAVEGDGMHIR